MWWVVSQIWLNSDSNELSQSWVRLVNLGFELSRSWVRLANLGFELSRSWVTWIVIWVRVESARKNESSFPWVWQKPKWVGQPPHQLNRKLHPWPRARSRLPPAGTSPLNENGEIPVLSMAFTLIQYLRLSFESVSAEFGPVWVKLAVLRTKMRKCLNLTFHLTFTWHVTC